MASYGGRVARRVAWIVMALICILPSVAVAQHGMVYAGAMADGATVFMELRVDAEGDARLRVTSEPMSGISTWRPELDLAATAAWTERGVELTADDPLGVEVWAARTPGERGLDPFGFATLRIRRPEPASEGEIRLAAIGTSLDVDAVLGDGSLEVRRSAPFFYEEPWAGLPLEQRLLATIGTDLAEGLGQRKERPQGVGARWFESLDAQIVGFGPTLVSVVWTRSSYTGGAHPNQWTDASTWARKNGVWSEVGLCEALGALRVPCAESRLRDLVLERLAEAGAMGVVEGAVTPSTPWLLDVFSLTPTAVRFDFSPYQVGPYAQGPFTVTIPYADVAAP